MIKIQAVTLQRGTKILLEQASLAIFARQKVGLVGINGCGKSSLFALLLRQLTPEAGNVFLPSDIRIAHLSQEVPNSTMLAIQYVISGDEQITDLLQRLKRAEEKNDHQQIADLHTKLYEADGYAAEAKAAKLLNGLGFSDSEHYKSVNEFSGGWRMRLNLAKVLMCRADLLLLDEPTNYLDMDAIIWLERWLQKFTGTLLLISHDREFLDNTVQKIAHIANRKIDLYSGSYSDFEEQRAEKLAQEQALFEQQQAKIKHITKYVDRFRYKASKARQAQSRLKMLEKMERVTITKLDSPFSFKFYPSQNCSAPLVKFDGVDFGYDEAMVLKNVNFDLAPKDRIGILGLNGAGKSTFMKLLSGNLAAKNGTITVNKNLKIGYFAQHQVDQLQLKNSACFHLLQINPTATEQQVRSFLGGFGFSGDMAFGSIENFSGGEKARLVLAMLVWQKPNLLLLDEPTNHLDLDMREMLTYALQDYTGALVVVSHDRYLLKASVDEFYLVHDQQVNQFVGDLNDYQTWLLEVRKQQFAEDEHKLLTSTASKNEVKQSAPKNTTYAKQIRQLEDKLTKLHQTKKLCEEQLADSAMYEVSNHEALQACLAKVAELDKEIKIIEEKWMELSVVEP